MLHRGTRNSAGDAAGLGQGAARLPRGRQFFDVAVPYMAGRVHPYSEQRIERLVQLDHDDLRLAA